MQTVVDQPTETVRQSESPLDRSIDLTRIPAEWAVWMGVLVAMLVTRLIGRTSLPLAPREAGIAHDGWLLAQGADVSSAADAHPLLVQIAALTFFLFGDTDFIARLTPLLAGVGVLAALFWLRHWIGNLPALSTAIVWTISPLMTMSTLRLDGGTLLMMSSLLILGAVFVMAVDPGPGKALVLGISLAIAVTAHPLGWMIALFTLVPALFLVRRPQLGGYLTHAGIGFLVTFILSVTWFLTRPFALATYFERSFSVLWQDYLASLWTDAPLTVLLLIVYEPLVLLLAVIGVVLAFIGPGWQVGTQPALVLSTAIWALPMLALGLMLGGKGPALYAATLFPLILVAGLGLSTVLDGLRSIESNRIRVLVWTLTTLGLLVAIVRLSDLLVSGPGDDGTVWVINALALAMLIILPLGYLAYRLTPAISQYLLPASLALIIALVAVVTLRGALTVTSAGEDQTGEILLAEATTPAVHALHGRVTSYSRDQTIVDRDARDPVGGHGLLLAIDPDVRDPFQWYFRAFPNLTTVSDPGELAEVQQPHMIFVDEADREEYLSAFSGYEQRSYPTRFALARDGDAPAYVDLLALTANPLRYGDLTDVIVHRTGARLLEFERTTLLVRDDHAESFWGQLPEQD